MVLATNLGGKAVNLIALQSIPGISVPPFTVMPNSLSASEAIAQVGMFLREHPDLSKVAVRSSATGEDSSLASFAGMFATKLNVPASVEAIIAAAEQIRRHGTTKSKVASHYTVSRGLRSSDNRIAVIVQKMVQPDFSGVALSHSLRERDGYYLISLTQGVGEAVASGSVNGRLVRVARSTDPDGLREAWLGNLIKTMKLLERHFSNESLDVEFAFEKGVLHVLQCRPITTQPVTVVAPDNEGRLACQLSGLSASLAANFRDDVLGDMIDINPAELLGRAPTRLDISIFGQLFADNVVERVRKEMGYDPLGVGLIREIAGKPYVSLKASAFSFRPNGVPRDVYEKLYSVYRDMLVADPGLQSRVEFAVFAMRDGGKLERVMESAAITGPERDVVRNAYRKLDVSLDAASRKCAAELASWYTDYERGMPTVNEKSLTELLAYTASGTNQFVRVARLAFYWKNRFEELHPEADLNELLTGHIQSVSSSMQNDILACREGLLTCPDLVKRYGHLRPGQFSVFGESYRDDPQHYLFDRLPEARDPRIRKRRHRYETTEEFRNVVTFMQAREETKFLFSRALDVFVGSLKAALDSRGISYDIASQCSWPDLECAIRIGSQLSQKEKGNLPMILPDVIIPGVSDLRVTTSHAAAPSYITRKVVKARVCVVDNPSEHEDVSGAIVVIPNADPGYDFLFHSGAAAIITRTGGPASHMCIRAVELQMPSCIGCGEDLYEALLRSRTAVLDCTSGQIIIPE